MAKKSEKEDLWPLEEAAEVFEPVVDAEPEPETEAPVIRFEATFDRKKADDWLGNAYLRLTEVFDAVTVEQLDLPERKLKDLVRYAALSVKVGGELRLACGQEAYMEKLVESGMFKPGKACDYRRIA